MPAIDATLPRFLILRRHWFFASARGARACRAARLRGSRAWCEVRYGACMIIAQLDHAARVSGARMLALMLLIIADIFFFDA